MTRKKSNLRERRREQQDADTRARRLRWVAVLGVAVLLVAVLVAFRGGDENGAPEVQAGLSPANMQGSPDAPVQIVEFADFGCTSCRAWHQSGVKEQLMAEFGEQVNFTFRHLPVITLQSSKAAEAAQCAADQDAFWQYHDLLYEQAGPGRLSTSELKQYAAALGLDAATFDDCLDSGRYETYVQRDLQAALDMGARGTPSFYVNDEPAFLFTYDAAAAAIQEHLN